MPYTVSMAKRNKTKRRIVREKFRKRSSSIVRKANQLAHIAGADIYVVIYHENNYLIYSSTDQAGWPPPKEVLVMVLRFGIGAADHLHDRTAMSRPRFAKAHRVLGRWAREVKRKGRKRHEPLAFNQTASSKPKMTWRTKRARPNMAHACFLYPSPQCCTGQPDEQRSNPNTFDVQA